MPSGPQSLELCIIDWELAQLGTPAFDLGQLLADFYFLAHFENIPAGTALIPSFLKGYGPVADEIAFRVAIDFGAHLVLWPYRNPDAGKGVEVETCVRMGRDIITHAREKHKSWFKGGVLDNIFAYY